MASLQAKIGSMQRCTNRSLASVPRRVRCSSLKENLVGLPSIQGISSISLPALNHSIPNIPGKQASVSIYNHIYQLYGAQLTPTSATEALRLYDEVVIDAQARPGAHPNIDILLECVSKGQTLEIVIVRAE